MKKPILISSIAAVTLVILALAAACSQSHKSSKASSNSPRLAIVMVIDQMRADYLTRWVSDYSRGLHRLLSEGAVYTNARHDHALTVTAAGHATIATGTIPAHHGIVGNSFFDRILGHNVNSVADSTTMLVGGHQSTGSSPKYLMRSTIGDWLKVASPNSKVIAASLKDRAAILPGGKHPDGVFWYDHRTGNFVTSTFYANAMPLWASDFNKSGAKEIWRDSVWNECDPTVIYQGKDSVAAEEGGLAHSAFPHPIVAASDTDPAAYYDDLYGTPFADALLLKFCRQLLDSEHLGEDTIPDLFMISLSAADLVGHAYGPDSHEIEDYYLRLDKQLGDFLDTLDAHVGKGNYVFVLSSDHGVCPLPELATTEGMPDALRLRADVAQRDFAKVLTEAFADCKHSEPLLYRAAGGLKVDSAVASSCGLTVSEVEDRAADAIKKLDYVEDVFTFDQLSSGSEDDREFEQLFKNSFDPERSPDLMINFKEGVLLTSSSTGTSHGSPYSYDTDVPIIVYGEGVSSGTINAPARTVDIAPTVAAFLHITPDPGVDGHVLPLTD